MPKIKRLPTSWTSALILLIIKKNKLLHLFAFINNFKILHTRKQKSVDKRIFDEFSMHFCIVYKLKIQYSIIFKLNTMMMMLYSSSTFKWGNNPFFSSDINSNNCIRRLIKLHLLVCNSIFMWRTHHFSVLMCQTRG